MDSTVLRAKGGVWYKKDREAGVVPHTSIDTEAGWTKSGWHGWVYGWKLHVLCAAGPVWLPLAADLTPATTADNTLAPALLREAPLDLRFLLGDQHYRDAVLADVCATRLPAHRAYRPELSAHRPRRRGAPPPAPDALGDHRDLQRAVQGYLQNAHAQVPTRGLAATRRYALGAIFVYQLVLLQRHHQQADLRVGLKAFLKAA